MLIYSSRAFCESETFGIGLDSDTNLKEIKVMGVCLKCKLDPCQCGADEDNDAASQDISEKPTIRLDRPPEE